MPRKRPFHQAKKVPLSDSERVQAKMLSKWAIRLAIRQEAQLLLDQGADENYLHDLRIGTTTSLCGHETAMRRWGASSAEACRRAQKRVREAGLVDTALYLSVLYNTGKDAPPPIFLGSRSGIDDGVLGAGLAWSPGSGVDPSIRVRRYPPAEQLVLWDADDVPWVWWSEMRTLDALEAAK